MSGPQALRALLDPLDDPGIAFERLMDYSALLLRHNRGANLIGPMDQAQILRELLVDSLLPGLAVAPRGPLMDVGSGAGLPGIPLAILSPQTEVHLIEPRQKRVTFLKIAARRLGLEHVHVHQARIEDFTALAPGEVGTAAAKAFRAPSAWLEEAHRWLRPGGQAYLFLSEASWDKEAQARALGLDFEELARLNHPDHPGRFGAVLRRL